MSGRGYRQKVLVLGKQLRLGDVADVHVHHAERCPALRGHGCRCDPEVEAVGVSLDGSPIRFRVTESGEVEAQA